MQVSICSYYGDSPSAQSNAKKVSIGDLTLYFSYETIVGFHHYTTGNVARENDWGPTTGKHFNVFSEKKERLGAEQFQAKLQELLRKIKWEEDKVE